MLPEILIKPNPNIRWANQGSHRHTLQLPTGFYPRQCRRRRFQGVLVNDLPYSAADIATGTFYLQVS